MQRADLASLIDNSIMVSTFLLALAIQLVVQISHDQLVAADLRLMHLVCAPDGGCADARQAPWSGQYLDVVYRTASIFTLTVVSSVCLSLTLAFTRDDRVSAWGVLFGWLLVLVSLVGPCIATAMLFRKRLHQLRDLLKQTVGVREPTDDSPSTERTSPIYEADSGFELSDIHARSSDVAGEHQRKTSTILCTQHVAV